MKICERCQKKYSDTSNRQKYCFDCIPIIAREYSKRWQKRWRKNNLERAREKDRRNRIRYKDKRIKYGREYYKKQKDTEVYKKRINKWWKEHPNKKKGYNRKYYLKTRDIKWERNVGRKIPQETKERLSETLKEYWGKASDRREEMSRQKSGTNSPFWKGGRTKECLYKHITDLKWKTWRESVFKRDGWSCKKCGNKSGKGKFVYLHAHHLKSWTKFSKLRYEIANGITLCRKCHFIIHKNL